MQGRGVTVRNIITDDDYEEVWARQSVTVMSPTTTKGKTIEYTNIRYVQLLRKPMHIIT